MTEHTFSIHCSHCGDEIETHQVEDGLIKSDEYHSCYGEIVGGVAVLDGSMFKLLADHGDYEVRFHE